MTWRYLVTPPSTGAENMALDEALMQRAAASGEWVLRVYSWSRPTISLGRNQTARDHYDLEAIRARGYGMVRRPTGGRAILHHREITYSVTAPVDDAGDLRTSYGRINTLLVDALRRLGVGVQVATPRERAVAPGLTPCFDTPSAGELVVGQHKLAGSAQWRADGGLLQHGSILIADDQTELAALTRTPMRAPPPPATLSAALGHTPSVGEVATALLDALRAREDAGVSALCPDDDLRARTRDLVVRYLDDGWTWRR